MGAIRVAEVDPATDERVVSNALPGRWRQRIVGSGACPACRCGSRKGLLL